MNETATGIGISRLGQIAIHAHDTGRATGFYRDVRGLPLLFTAGNLAFFDGGGVRLMLTPPEKPQFDHPGSILYFNLPDIKAAYGRMLASGVRFQDDPPPHRQNAQPRFVNDVFPRHRGQPAGADE